MQEELMKLDYNPFSTKVEIFESTDLIELKNKMNGFMEELPCESLVKDVKLYPYSKCDLHLGMIIYL